ncbi:MAG TPA: UDP-N-acetylmuramate dehydrogenase [Casimicrobiaceae bacterium]|nr:UDP-N-acetylmuramate dehydrogenase [Casimicrobiaceae bacterium]
MITRQHAATSGRPCVASSLADLPSGTLRGELRQNASLARYTTWRCGGNADRLYLPADRDDLAAFIRSLPASEPVIAIGLGSNLLVRDAGVRGTVVVMHPALGSITLENGLIHAEAGVASPKVARFAATHGRADAEFLAGVPGTVGGALAMNAGCYGGETWRYVARVEVLTRAGVFEQRTRDQYAIGYRTVRRLDGSAPDGLFTAAWFDFPVGDSDAARERIRELLKRRIATQPLDLPNAGSVFRNPQGDHAARLIESCGLKGFAIGGARVSEKHANFIVNPQGQAKASDIERLIEHVHATVRARMGVELEAEVRVIGEAAESGATRQGSVS